MTTKINLEDNYLKIYFQQKIFLVEEKEVNENEVLTNNENEMGSLKASKSEQRYVLYESPDGYEYWLNVEADVILKEIRAFEFDSNNWDFKSNFQNLFST